jgi:hypothetical protein
LRGLWSKGSTMGKCQSRVCLLLVTFISSHRVLMCIDCSGIHRNLGVHISTVKSLTLDKWQQKWIDMVSRVGNKVANSYYESRLPSNFRRPGHGDGVTAVENFIRAKYARKEFSPKDEPAPCDLVLQGLVPSRIASPPTSAGNSPARVTRTSVEKKTQIPQASVDLLGGFGSPTNRTTSPKSSTQTIGTLLDNRPFPAAPSSPSRTSHVIHHYHPSHTGHPYAQSTAFPSFPSQPTSGLPLMDPPRLRGTSPPKSKRGGLSEIDPFASLISSSKK